MRAGCEGGAELGAKGCEQSKRGAEKNCARRPNFAPLKNPEYAPAYNRSTEIEKIGSLGEKGNIRQGGSEQVIGGGGVPPPLPPWVDGERKR